MPSPDADGWAVRVVRTAIGGTALLCVAPVWWAAAKEQPMTTSTGDVHEGSSSQQCPLPVSETEFKRRLSAEQYHVMREGGTEQPFNNAYWNNKRPGVYVDPVTGEALFASTDKFDSRTGWPSFTRPVKPEMVTEKTDASQGMARTEVLAKGSGSHLGHVFDDGPGPTGLRYCINSAALRFVPLEDLEKEGYGQYRSLFEPQSAAPQAASAAPLDAFPPTPKMLVWGFTMTTIDGRAQPLAAYRGKVLLVVNVASWCGFTPQYAALETLYQQYRDRGFEVLAFPANNFMGQEPGTNQEIKQFCELTFHTTFPLFAKISVAGADIHPLYKYLTSIDGVRGPITWNFNKFLIGPDGAVVARFDSKTDPLSPTLVDQLNALLPKSS